MSNPPLEVEETIGRRTDDVFIVFEWRNPIDRQKRPSRMAVLGLYWSESLARERVRQAWKENPGEDWRSASESEMPGPPIPLADSAPVMSWKISQRQKDSYRVAISIWQVTVHGSVVDRLAALGGKA